MKALPVPGLTAAPSRLRFWRLAAAFVALGGASAGVNAGSTLQVAANFETTCAVVAGAAYCWGYNANGQLGNNSTSPSSSPVQVSGLTAGVSAITTSGSHSCAVVSGAAWCWGKNADGQLGDNTNVQKLVPVQVSGLTSGVTAISAGDDHTCAIVDGGVKCWGANIGYGQLGDGTSNASKVPVSVVGLTGVVTALSAGRQHNCALAEGALYCWGRADSGELGNGTSPLVSRTPVAVTGGAGASFVDGGGSFACMTNAAGAKCWGFGGQGQLGNSGSIGNSSPQQVTGLTGGVTAVAAGSSYHGCAIVNGGLQCWGYNNAGQLGNPAAGGGTTAPTAVSGLGSGVFQVAAGGLHTCAVATGGLYCWGDNPSGALGTGNNTASNVPVLVLAAPAGFDAVFVNPPDLGFSPQSQNTTSPPLTVTVTNNGASTVTITGVSVSSSHFAQANNCGALAPNASCAINVTFTPTTSGPLAGTITIATATQNIAVELAGLGERSLVTHYYRAILNRPPDGPGKTFWEGEATRLSALGVNINETWFVMAGYFFNSAEYLAANKTDTQFVTDLYNTFFNRPPDGGGLGYWTSQISGGLPREVVLFSFMFSTEFRTFTQGIFGNTAARPEVDMVVDFFRGLLNRLPDTTSFNYWLARLRTAQCAGAGPVYTEVDAISAAFMFNAEYDNRARSNTQFVTDMYYSFLRRGGDIGGVQYWINELNTGARYRNDVRYFGFLNGAEFGARVQAVIAAGCVP